jgi:Zn-dependent protease with chaperone function
MSHTATYLAFGGAVAVALLPHARRPGRELPLASALLWAAALAMRALFTVCVALLDLFVLPSSGAFHVLAGWCQNLSLPGTGTMHVAGGAILGILLTFAPALLTLGGTLYVVLELRRASRALKRAISTAEIGPGPDGSTVISSNEVLLAAAGIVQPRIVVSSAALAVLDGQELRAALAHERAHIRRRHRYLLVVATVCRGASWLLPGGRHALEQVAFQLERDADDAALAHEDDRLALASAICKAALPERARSVPLAALAGSGSVTQRVSELIADAHDHRHGRNSHAAFMLMLLAATALTAVTIHAMAAMAALPHITIC